VSNNYPVQSKQKQLLSNRFYPVQLPYIYKNKYKQSVLSKIMISISQQWAGNEVITIHILFY